MTDAIGYDSYGERSSYAAKFGTATTLFSTSYVRDALGRIATKTEIVQGATHNYAYTYDAPGRLKTVTKDGATTTYTYDADGNRLGASSSGTSVTGSYDAQDRLLTYGTLSYTYGPAGEVLSKTDSATGAVTTYTYDALGNLVRVVLPGDYVIQYTLDAAGRRVAKSVNGQLRQAWLYRDSTRPVAELDASGAVVARFVYADNAIADTSALDSLNDRLGLSSGSPVTAVVGAPAYVVQGGQTLRVIADHLGSARLLVNASTGVVVEALDYDEFGNVIPATGANVPTLAFGGGLYDADTNLVHFGARDYDAQTGRWTSKEPVKTSGALNFYQYANGDPINGSDHSGLAPLTSPQKQTVLDSLCGPDALGVVVCAQGAAGAPGELQVAQAGSGSTAATDTTTQPTPSTDLLLHRGRDGADKRRVGRSGRVVFRRESAAHGQRRHEQHAHDEHAREERRPERHGYDHRAVPRVRRLEPAERPRPRRLWQPIRRGDDGDLPADGCVRARPDRVGPQVPGERHPDVTVLGAPLVQVSGPANVDLFDAQNRYRPRLRGQVTEPLVRPHGHGDVEHGLGTGHRELRDATRRSRPERRRRHHHGASSAPRERTSSSLTAGERHLQRDGDRSTRHDRGDEAPVISTSGDQTLPSPGPTVVNVAAVGVLADLPLLYTWSEVERPRARGIDTSDRDGTSLYLPYPGVLRDPGRGERHGARRRRRRSRSPCEARAAARTSSDLRRARPSSEGLSRRRVVTQPTQLDRHRSTTHSGRCSTVSAAATTSTRHGRRSRPVQER